MLARYVRRRATAVTALALVACLGLPATGCEDACVELSKVVCKCEPTEAEQRACTQRVDNEAANETTTDAEKERCETLLDECDCDKLEQGDLAACGLADDSTG